MTVLQQADLFTDGLAYRPYCTDDLLAGLLIRSKPQALKRRYIQPNQPTQKYALVFDCDYAAAAIDWQERPGVPMPNFTAENKQNGHAHLFYILREPVCTSDYARRKPLAYAAAVYSTLRDELDADPCYRTFISKNPLHDHWRVMAWYPHAYDLGELARNLDLHDIRQIEKKPAEAVAFGRNHCLFNGLARWSYRGIRDYWDGTFDRWHSAVLDNAISLNVFPEPLPYSEVKASAKSVACWTWREFTPEGLAEWHARKGKAGGIAKGKAYEDRASSARILKAAGRSYQQIADELEVSRRAVINWCK